jgi:UDP-2,4-diacetamido-2,4,6-trideoxy-beta-L-altropyranose hydrolase
VKRALIRADASARIGGGHATRCAALGAALAARGWRVGFAARPETWTVVPELVAPGIGDIVLSEGRELEECLPRGIDLLVVDHHGWDAGREAGIRRRVGKLLAIDDLARPHNADFLVDQNFGRTERDYSGHVPAECQLLLGPHFALLSPSFAQSAPLCDGPPIARRIFVGLGRTDPIGATATVLEGLARGPIDLAIEVMLGGQAPHLTRVREVAERIGPRVKLHIDPPDPLAVMAVCDIAIGAVGGSAWERCCLGLPSLVVICADNQRDAAIALANAGVVSLLGDAEAMSPAALAEAVIAGVGLIVADKVERDRLGRAARELCDGRGAQRVAESVDGVVVAS